MSNTFALIGCGKAGLSLSLVLKGLGWSVASCWSRSPESAARGSEWLGCPVHDLPKKLPPNIPLILAVPEGALPEVERKVAKEDSHLNGRVVIHLCGALPARILNHCRLGGAKVGSFHPIMTLPDPLTGARRLKGATFALEGRPEAMRFMQSMAEAISGRFFILSPRGKTLYHAAAVMASNHVVALVRESQELLLLAGVDPAMVEPAFEALVRGTVENIYASGTTQAMTGPIERGDRDTIESHLRTLKRWPKRLQLYRVLALKALEISRRLHPERAESYAVLENLLD